MPATAGLLSFALSGMLLVETSPLAAQSGTNAYTRRNLVADQASAGADATDPLLVNVWGICFSATGPFWVSNTGSGTSTVYSGKGPLAVSTLKPNIPAAPSSGSAKGTPTGCIIGNGSFPIKPGVNASFIFDTLDGTISAWANGADPNNAVIMVDNSGSGASYTGLALGGTSTNQLIYAANFAGNAIEVYDSTYKKVSMPGAFTDAQIPAGYAPFNIWPLTTGGITKLYVTYHLQGATNKKDYVSGIGAGVGYVDAYDMNGVLLQRVAAKGVLNAPWGVAIAPASFGVYSGMLLVGNFGDGKINVFDPVSGASMGPLNDTSGNAIAISGLWALIAGNGGSGGDSNAIYFAAGTGGQQHGVLGSLQAAPAVTSASVVNAASFVQGASSGEYVSIFGANMASTTRLWQSSDFVNGALPTSIENVSVTIDGRSAYIAYVSPSQLNIIPPTVSTIGPVTISVKNNGLTSNNITVNMSAVHPGYFIFKNNAIVAFHADNVTPIGASGLVPGSTPAKPGETITTWLTGLGPTTPAYPDGQVLTTSYPCSGTPTVMVGGTPATVTYAGLVVAGVYQVNVTIPMTAPDGDLPVTLQIGGTSTQANAIITVQH
jgi:uncharacterized protein (TIGR03118 family)